MDVETLRLSVENSGYAAVGLAFLAGLVFSFNPVALASIPVSLAYVTRGRDRTQAIVFGGMFVLGMVLTHVGLGIAAGLGGSWIRYLVGRWWSLVLGPLLIILGLVWAGWLRVPLPKYGFKASRPVAAWGAFLLGIPFAIAVCPFCTPGTDCSVGGDGGDWVGNARGCAASLLCFGPRDPHRLGSRCGKLAQEP